jgi:putative endonuclease
MEAKTRNSYDEAAYSITTQQQQRKINTAKAYIMENPKISDFDMRFVAILNLPFQLPIHLKGCGRPDK